MIELDRRIPLVLLTAEEAAEYLRLTEGRSGTAALRAIDRLVASKQLRPAIVGKHRRFSVVELDRFIAQRTEQYGELHG